MIGVTNNRFKKIVSRGAGNLLRGAALIGLLVLISSRVLAANSDTLRKIQQLIQGGNLVEARSQLMQLLNASPNDPADLDLLGILEAKEGNYSAAETSFRKAITAAPHFTSAYLNLGHLYQEFSSKDPSALKKGVDTYEQVLRFEPANVEATYQCALLLMRLGSYQASLARLAHFPPSGRERPQSLAIRCADLAGLKAGAKTQATVRQLLRHPDLVEADVLGIVPTLLAQHNEELATQLLKGLESRSLASTASLHRLASLYRQQGQFGEARATLEELARKQGVSVRLLVELAHIANEQGDYKGALGYLAHARDLEPDNGSVHFFFGMVCEEMNMTEEAYRSLKKAVSLNPDNAYYNYALGAVMLMNQQTIRDAVPYFKKYCRLKPSDPRGRLALGAAYFYYGHDKDLARRELQIALKHQATAAAAHYYLGRLANREGKFDEAEQDLQEAVEGKPNFASAYAELGLLYIKQKKYAEAERVLRKSLAISPNNYTANLNLLMLYQRTGNPHAEEQAKRFQAVRNLRAQRDKEFFRIIKVRP